MDDRSRRLRVMTAGFFLSLCVFAALLWPEGSQVLRQFLLPGEPTATEQAFLVLVEELRMGEPLSDAVTVFCRSVVADEVQNGG